MEIIPIVYGKSTLPESMVFAYGSEKLRRPIPFKIFLIKNENKSILVDVGCETMPGFDMEDFIGPIQGLKNLNISPEEITDVIITHTHHDHVECVNHFANATIYVQKQEYENGKHFFSPNLSVKLFESEVRICERIRVLKIGGHSVGSCIVEIQTESAQTVILAGDECYMRECLEKKIRTGASYQPEQSQYFVEEYSKDKYKVYLCHDD